MEHNNTEILIRIAHISELTLALSQELDRLYEALAKKNIEKEGA